jgi:hypothetical protein
MAINWSTPTEEATRIGRRENEEFADALRKRPGQFAILGEYRTPEATRNMGNRIQNGKLKAFKPAGAFEAWSEPKGTTLWVAFTGGTEAAGGNGAGEVPDAEIVDDGEE